MISAGTIKKESPMNNLETIKFCEMACDLNFVMNLDS